MFRNILVPLDGSKRAEKILPYVEELAFARDAKVIFLQVIDPVTETIGATDIMPYSSQEMAEQALNEIHAYLSALVDDFGSKGLNAKSVIKHGGIAHTILEVAEQENADLIALASHGRTGLALAFYGSVAAAILHQTDRPLLLIRSAEPQQPTS